MKRSSRKAGDRERKTIQENSHEILHGRGRF
jgi:hypothetical protein